MYVGVYVSSQVFCGVVVVEQCDGWHRSPCAGPSQRAANLIANTHFLVLLFKIRKTSVSYGASTIVQNSGTSNAANAGNLRARGTVCLNAPMFVYFAYVG